MAAAILLVDDNLIQAATRKAILNRAGFEVAVCSGAQDALDWMQDPTRSDSLALIITDHVMPGMHGSGFAAAVRKTSATLPILVISGLPDAESEYLGMDVIFRSKPFAPDALITLTRYLITQPTTRTA